MVFIEWIETPQRDVLWYRDGRVPRSTEPPPYPLPDLAVEVGSLSNSSFDAGPKRENYEAAGLPELWLVDPADGGVFVHRRSREHERAFDILETLSERDELTSPLLPGFRCPWATSSGRRVEQLDLLHVRDALRHPERGQPAHVGDQRRMAL